MSPALCNSAHTASRTRVTRANRSWLSPSAGFSLLETIIAIGIFAGGVLALAALLSAAARHIGDARERMVAQRLGDAVRVELQQLVAERGFDAVATSATPFDDQQLAGILFAADRRGARVRRLGDEATVDRFFLIEVGRFETGPLAYDPADSHVALAIRVSWPFRGAASDVPDSSPSSRRALTFSVLVNR